MVYGAGGAIITRAGGAIAEGFVPGQFATSPLMRPVVQAGLAVTVVRMLGAKFFGQKQGDLMMGGGLISAGLALADVYLPNVQSQITNIFRAPLAIGTTVPVNTVGGFGGGGRMGDVYDVQVLPGSFGGLGGLGDVEDVPIGIFS